MEGVISWEALGSIIPVFWGKTKVEHEETLQITLSVKCS